MSTKRKTTKKATPAAPADSIIPSPVKIGRTDDPVLEPELDKIAGQFPPDCRHALAMKLDRWARQLRATADFASAFNVPGEGKTPSNQAENPESWSAFSARQVDERLQEIAEFFRTFLVGRRFRSSMVESKLLRGENVSTRSAAISDINACDLALEWVARMEESITKRRCVEGN